jgi:hypothetical protein
MSIEYLTYKKFNNEDSAKEFAKLLSKNNITVEIDDNVKSFDPSFASNPLRREICIKLLSKDFNEAQKILEDYHKNLITDVEEDYYLFDFTDQELTEIIMKPDEWGDFDYQLAQKILNDRGLEVKPKIVTLLRKQRNDDLSKPETSSKYILYLGYISAFFGGLIGILIGWHLSYSKKVLPDGRKVNRYTEVERNHGGRILLLAIICLVFWIIIRSLFNNK